jgi:hypothetical protein
MRSIWIFFILCLLFSSSIYAQTNKAPIIHYTFDVDNQDVSGNEHHGTLLNNAYIADGFLHLDGDDDAFKIPKVGTSTEITFAMWIYPTMDPTPLQFSGGLNTNGWDPGAIHFKLNYGAVNVGINGHTADVVGTTVVDTSQWNHIALTVSETEAVLYLNGSVEGTSTLNAPLDLIVGYALVGAWYSTTIQIEREMRGKMDEVLIYTRSLSEEEIDSLASLAPDKSTSVKDSDITPELFSLSQNYPNPFNPTTTIAYTLGVNSKVKLSLYDMNGSEVAVLVDNKIPAGAHSVNFSGENLSSGIYFYKLQTDNQIITRKMMLIK